MSNTVNPIGWFEIAGSDTAKTEAFYGELFGWTFSDDAVGPQYRIADAGGMPGGVTTAQAGLPKHYAVFSIIVPDVAATCERVRELGGEVLVGPETVPDNGLTFAHVADLDGNHIGVFCPPAG